jgi:hypothetical protein
MVLKWPLLKFRMIGTCLISLDIGLFTPTNCAHDVRKMTRIQWKSTVYGVWLWFHVEQCKVNIGVPRLLYTADKHFEQLHSGAVKLSPELYFVLVECQNGRSQWPHGFTTSCLLRLSSNPAGGMNVYFVWMLCIVRSRSLRRADHSSRMSTECGVYGDYTTLLYWESRE